MSVPVPLHPRGYREVEKLPKSFQLMPALLHLAGAGVPGEAGAAGPTLCLLSAATRAPCCFMPPRLFCCQWVSVVPLSGWGHCVGPGSIGGPGVSCAQLISSDFLQGGSQASAILHYPGHVSTHFLLLFPLAGSVFLGGLLPTRLGVVGGMPVYSELLLSQHLTAAGAAEGAAKLCGLKTRRRRRCSEASLQGRTRLSRGWREVRASFRLLVPLCPLPASLWADAWQDQARGRVNCLGVTMLSAGLVTVAVPGAWWRRG